MIVRTYFSTLLKLAREQYLAEKSGNEEWIKKARKDHEDYRQLCLKYPMIIGSSKLFKDNL